jgi:WD40 repeat protein
VRTAIPQTDHVASGREIRTFIGHSGTSIGPSVVFSVAFAPGGATALSGTMDRRLVLWDIASGRKIRTFAGHSDEVDSVAFSPDGATALSGSFDHALKLWDVGSGREIRTLSAHSRVVTSALLCRGASITR